MKTASAVSPTWNAPADDNAPPDMAQAFERELEPDPKQQQHDADVGDLADLPRVRDQADSLWPEDRTRNEEARDNGEVSGG